MAIKSLSSSIRPFEDQVCPEFVKISPLIICILLSVILLPDAFAQPELDLEHTELLRDIDFIGDLSTGDVDGDGTTEIIMLNTVSMADDVVELRLARWDSERYSELAHESWQVDELPTHARAVNCGDVEGDGSTEIVTAVYHDPNPTSAHAQSELRSWDWDEERSVLTPRATYILDNAKINDIALADLDGDGSEELIAGGYLIDESNEDYPFSLWIFECTDSTIEEASSTSWTWTLSSGENPPSHKNGITGVGAADLDLDGAIEIVSIGQYDYEFDIRLWQWDGTTFHELDAERWNRFGDSEPQAVAIGNLNADDLLEIAVVGTASDLGASDINYRLFGAITAWRWDGNELQYLADNLWQSSRGSVELFGVSIIDADSLGSGSIVAIGPVHVSPATNALVAFSLEDGRALELLDSEEWLPEGINDSYPYSIDVADVNNDGYTEILSGGRAVERGTLENLGELDISKLIVLIPPSHISVPEIIIPEVPLNLFLIDCGPCPACFERMCDPRVNPGLDKFLIWDPLENILQSFSYKDLGLKASDGHLAAGAPIISKNGQITFVVSVPGADYGGKDSGSIIFFDKSGKILGRIDGEKTGEQLGMSMDVSKSEVAVASSLRVLRVRDNKVVSSIPLRKDLQGDKEVRVAFTEDIDADNSPEIVVGTPFAAIKNVLEANRVQVIGSRSGTAFNTMPSRWDLSSHGEMK
jgi:hypothetical protein